MASNVCPFNLAEVCETTIALMKDPEHDILSTSKDPISPAADLCSTTRQSFNKVYETGRGSVKLRSKYSYDKAANCIEVTEIPYTPLLRLSSTR